MHFQCRYDTAVGSMYVFPSVVKDPSLKKLFPIPEFLQGYLQSL